MGSHLTPPLVRLAKINVDVALSKNTGVASAVARNYGKFLGTSTLGLEGIIDLGTTNVIKNLQESGVNIYHHIVKENKVRVSNFSFF